MKTRELKVARIGNSRGVRLPAETLRRYAIGAAVLMEERAEGILLRSQGSAGDRLPWEDTAREMAASQEDWSDWDATAGDGVAGLPWDHALPAVAEPRPEYGKAVKPGRRKHGRSSAA